MDLLGSALHASEKGRQVVAGNIANVNTPGYKTKRLECERLLEQIQSGERDVAVQDLPIEEVEGLVDRVDGNNVSLEKEVAALKKNALVFQTFAHLLASKVSTMRNAISG